MTQEYRPDIEFEVSLWKNAESFGRLRLGLGINENTRQLLFFFGKMISDMEPAWWMVAERHLGLLDFFVDHRIFFDGQLGNSYTQSRQIRGYPVFDVHYESNAYDTLLELLEAKANRESGKPDDWISSRKMYSLVGVLTLIIKQMDSDSKIDEDEFDDKWNYFLDILEEKADSQS
jgi:hypothetical protein